MNEPNKDFTRNLSFKLRAMREYLGFNLSEASDALGFSNGMITGYENSRENPNLLYVHKLCTMCGLKLEDLFLERNDFIKKLYF